MTAMVPVQGTGQSLSPEACATVAAINGSDGIVGRTDDKSANRSGTSGRRSASTRSVDDGGGKGDYRIKKQEIEHGQVRLRAVHHRMYISNRWRPPEHPPLSSL